MEPAAVGVGVTQWRSCLQALGRSAQAGHRPTSALTQFIAARPCRAADRCVFGGLQGKVSLHHKVSAAARSSYDTLSTMKFIYSVCLMDMMEIHMKKVQILHRQHFRPEVQGSGGNELL